MVSATLKRILGIVCLVFGLAALVLPVVPGAFLIFVGMELLGLSFLLPAPVRSRWEIFKIKIWERWHHWRMRKKRWWGLYTF